MDKMEETNPTNEIEVRHSPERETDTREAIPSTSTQEKHDHLTGTALYALVSGLLLVTIIVTLDISILATAIPQITDDFHTIADIGWWGSAFLITNCALQPLAGRIYTFFPFKHSFIAFLSVFELGSLLCGVSVSSTMLVIGRAVCGIGSSGLMNGAMTIVGIAAPPSKRSVMMGLFMSFASTGQLIGPLIGGSLTEYVSWRWCFYINLPIGAVAIASIVFTKLPPSTTQGKDFRPKTLYRELDISGFLIFGPASAMLLLGLEWGGLEYPWNSPTVLGLLCGSAVTFVVFFFWERRQGDRGMIPASLLKNRLIYSSCLTSLLQGGSLIVVGYYLALWFQVIKEDSPTMSAVSTLPNFLCQVLFALVSGLLVSKVGYVMPFLLLGNVLVTLSYGLFTTLRVDTSIGQWIGYQILGGSGRGTAMQMPILIAQASVDMSRMATITALIAWSQFLGSALALTLAQTLFQNLLRSALNTYAPEVNAEAIVRAGATGFTAIVSPQDQPKVRLAYNDAIAHTFFLGVGTAAASVCVGLLVGTKKVSIRKEKLMAATRSTDEAVEESDKE